MKYLIIISLFCFSCKTTKQSKPVNYPTTMNQVFTQNQTQGLPGKCYQKTKLGQEMMWTEVICDSSYTKGLIATIHGYVQSLGYDIDPDEIANNKFGTTTKQAIKDFQMKNELSYGGMDWATFNHLRVQANK